MASYLLCGLSLRDQVAIAFTTFPVLPDKLDTIFTMLPVFWKRDLKSVHFGIFRPVSGPILDSDLLAFVAPPAEPQAPAPHSHTELQASVTPSHIDPHQGVHAAQPDAFCSGAY